MAKLRRILGADRLEMIRIEKPELYERLMDYVNSHRAITRRMCKELLEEYSLNFDVDHDVEFHKQLRAKAAREFGSDGGDDDSYFRHSANATKADPLHEMNKTSNSANLIGDGAGKNAGRMGGSLPKKEGKKNNMFQFVEWNF